MSTPTNPSGASTPSYSTNVNRSKTKKWIEAKPGDYGGDDWGDEYDDDDIYDPPPPPKPTGLRQKGQAMQQTANPLDTNKKTYGDLPAPPSQNYPRSSSGSGSLRKNSFDHGDEKRAFSSGPTSQKSVALPTVGSSNTVQRAGAPPLHVSTQPQPVTGLRKPSQSELPPVDVSVGKSNMQPSSTRPDSQSDFTPQTATASTVSYSDDIKTRRDYSPSAVPAPLSAISVPQSSSDSTAHFPPRKSSLSQQVPPNLSDRPGMQSIRSPTPPSTQKPLPFVRPADIYKRMAEERERERQSLDSSRPSMDSLGSDSVPDKSSLAAIPPVRGSANTDDNGPTKGDAENDAHGFHSARGLMPILEPVQERKSEYGFEGFNAKGLPLHSRETSDATQTSINETDNTTFAEKRYSRSPELPNLNRLSGFGDDFFSPAQGTHPDRTHDGKTLPSRTQELHDTEFANNQHSLRTDPSLGFRAAVNTAFENANSVPPTPSSRVGGGVGRSDSESTGTTGISPIMSRAPSATAEARSRDAEAREASTPAIAEVREPDSRRQSEVDGVPPKRATLDEEKALIPPARPRAEREESFRPTLPGGWNSYATNASVKTVQPDSTEFRELGNSEVSPVRENTEELDATPTAAKHPLPPTPDTSVASAPSDAEVASAARQQQNSPHETSPTEKFLAQTEKPLPEHAHSQIDIASGDDEDLPSPTPLKTKTNTTLSTESKRSDDVNDRLRKEIVKSLSPRTSSVGPDSISPDNVEELKSTGRDIRESYYLPAEYDNYWDEQDGTPTETSPREAKDEVIPIPPLAARKIEKLSETRPVAERRFSWEAGGEQVGTSPTSASDNHVQFPAVVPPTPTAMSDIIRDGSMGDAKAAAPNLTSSEAQINHQANNANNEDATSNTEAYVEEVAPATGGLATAATYGGGRDAAREKEHSPNLLPRDDEPPHPLSSSPVYRSEYPSTDAVPHSAISMDRVSSTDRDDDPTPISHTQRLSLPQGTGKDNFTTNTTLKELLQIPGPYDRIRACEVVQNKIIAADTGLDEWLIAMKSENPDYADIDGNYGGSTPFVASSRSKFSKALNPNSNTLQQPYYQQYLNASSPTSPQPNTTRPATNSGYTPSGGLSGFSAGGSKITTQQVQAKSKELLHTAGVFGGKGMKAGKGLLAKGKSRFASRGASGPGGADKIHDANPAITTVGDSRTSFSISQRSFGHRRNNTSDPIPRSLTGLGRRSEDDTAMGEQEIKGLSKRSTFGFSSGGHSSRFGSLGMAGRFSRFGRPGTVGDRKPKDDSNSRDVDRVGFASDLRGVHEMHFKKTDSVAPVLPAIAVNSSLESPTRAMSMDSSALAAREEYHRHKRSESGLSHDSRSGSAMSATRRDMSFFLADDDVSEESRDGSVSYGESDENVSYGVAKPAPISKFQPTWDPYMASPILEGEEESPLSRHGTNVVKLVQNIPVAPPPLPIAETSNTAPPTIPGASSSETPVESPIIGHAELDDEPEDWVMVQDTNQDTLLTPPIPPPNIFPPAIPPPTGQIPERPVSHGPAAHDFTPTSNVEHNVDPPSGSARPNMISIEREIAPSEMSVESGIESRGEESPAPSLPISRFVGSGMMTPEEVESPIIPNIFRTIKGDPPTQYARNSGFEKPEGQDSPKFSLPPIRRGSTFGNLISAWPGPLSRSGSKTSRASRRFPIDSDSDGELEEVPPMPPTPGFARPGTSESAKIAREKMKAVTVAESDEFSPPEENHTIGALVAAGLVAGIFGDEKPSPIEQWHSVDGNPHASDLEKRVSQVDIEKPELIPSPVDSPDTEAIENPKQTIGFTNSEGTVMLSNILHEQAPGVPARPSTPIKDTDNPSALQITPEVQPQSPEQSTPATLIDESRVPNRLSKSSEQWVENAPMADSYVPPNHPPPNHPPPSVPGPRPGHLSAESRGSLGAGQHRRSPHPDIRIDTTPESSPGLSSISPGLSTTANFNNSPLQHRSLPPYESPRIYIPPSTVRQTYHDDGSFQPPSSSLPHRDRELSPRDLPEQLYQAPIARDETLLPRQQVLEYQIAGIGPPPDEAPLSATRSSRRSSAFFKEIGGRLSRTGSLAPEDSAMPSSPAISRNNGTTAPSVSSITSDDIREKIRNQSRRSSLFNFGSGSLSRSSTTNANSVGPATPGIGNLPGGGNNGEFYAIKPSLRESMITHRPGSWRDTMDEDSRSPKSPISPLVPRSSTNGKEKRGPRAFFTTVSGPLANVKNLAPGDDTHIEPAPASKGKGSKKSRFSGLSFGGLLGRSGAGKNKEPIPEEKPPPLTPNSMSSIQRTPVEYRPRNKSLGQLPVLARPFQGRGNKNPLTGENHERADSEERARQRRASAHALLSGPLPPAYTPPMNGFSHEPFEEQEVERDPEKEDFAMHLHPAYRPAPKQTPIFIEEVPDRGRRKTKEPQYDTPPIPGAYNLVRGDGNSASSTNYDPHGRNSSGFGGRLMPQNDQASYNRSPASTSNSRSPPNPPIQQSQTQLFGANYSFPSSSHIPPQANTTPREEPQGFQSPPLQFDGAEESPWAESMSTGVMGLKQGLAFGEDGRVTWQQSRTRRNVSREDLLARSPARPTHGQQRPYQLTLPEEEDNSFHGKKDGSSESVRSGSTGTENREVKPGLGLGLGVGSRDGSQQGRKNSAGTGRHLGLHPDLKRSENEQNYRLLGEGTFSSINEATARDMANPSLRGQTSNAQLLLSPNSTRDMDLARSDSEVSQMSRNIVSPPLPAKGSPRLVDSTNSSTNNIDKYQNTVEQISGSLHRKREHVPIRVEGINIADTDADIYDASPVRPSHSNSSGQAGNSTRAMEPEEKIVDEYNQGRSDVVELPAGNDEDEDEIVMTATSYPGMEWNPYAYGQMEYE